MKIKELEQTLAPGTLARLAGEYFDLKKSSQGYYINPCPVCGHKDHFSIKGNFYNSFSDCCKSGGVYGFMIHILNYTEDKAFEELKRMSGAIDNKITPTNPFKDESTPPPLTADILEIYSATQDFSYLIDRGVSREQIGRYKIGIKDGYAYLPVWKDNEVIWYTRRNINPDAKKKDRYRDAAGHEKQPFFTREIIPGEPLVICEGIFDALPVDLCGYAAVALNGVANIKFLEHFKDNAFIIALDNDEAGEKVASQLTGYRFKIDDYKDLNEWAVKDVVGLEDALKLCFSRAKKPASSSAYLSDYFFDEQKRRSRIVATGISALDEAMDGGLRVGLHVIGGGTSLGKTTLAYQIAENIATREDVLYFSLEMSKYDLVAKSLTRLIPGSTASKIKCAQVDEKQVKKAIKEHQRQVEDRLSIYDLRSRITLEEIQFKIENFIKLNGITPVVVIDYLQIVPLEKEGLDTRARIDKVVSGLRDMTQAFYIPMIVLSSFNRSSYKKMVDYDSFKESGNIEFTADFTAGLQLSKVRTGNELSSADYHEEKSQDIRKLDFVCLKNREGKPHFTIEFDYEPAREKFYDGKILDKNNYVVKAKKGR